MLLAALALAAAVGLGQPGPPAPPSGPLTQLPPTQPGVSVDEGVFLVTPADDGSQAIYFIAQNARHSVLAADLGTEQQINPLWPVHTASRDEVLTFAEAAPVGRAPIGLLLAGPAAEAEPEGSDAWLEADDAAPETDTDATVTYTVQRGDSTISIARRFGVDEGSLLAANQIANRNRILIGQVLTIPTPPPA